MRNNSTVVATVIHNKSLKNLNAFLNTIYLQDDKKFDLLILNDSKKKLSLKKNNSINVLSFKYNKSINENRVKLIKEIIKKKYSYSIFVDSDDLMCLNRVRVCKQLLKKNKIVINDLNIFDEKKNLIKKNYFSVRIKNKKIIKQKDIKFKNFLGLSNTSCRVNILKKIKINILKDVPIFDWAFWFMVLNKNDAIFTNNTATNYLTKNNSLTFFLNRTNKALKLRKILKSQQLNFFKKNDLFNIKLSKEYNSNKFKNKFWWE